MYRDMAITKVWFPVSIHCIDVSILSQAVSEGALSKPNMPDTPIQHVQAFPTTVMECQKNSQEFQKPVRHYTDLSVSDMYRHW